MADESALNAPSERYVRLRTRLLKTLDTLRGDRRALDDNEITRRVRVRFGPPPYPFLRPEDDVPLGLRPPRGHGLTYALGALEERGFAPNAYMMYPEYIDEKGRTYERKHDTEDPATAVNAGRVVRLWCHVRRGIERPNGDGERLDLTYAPGRTAARRAENMAAERQRALSGTAVEPGAQLSARSRDWGLDPAAMAAARRRTSKRARIADDVEGDVAELADEGAAADAGLTVRWTAVAIASYFVGTHATGYVDVRRAT
jgi:hypothetical protein